MYDINDSKNNYYMWLPNSVLYIANLLRGKLSRLEQNMNINGKTFAVAASFNNEMSNLVNYLV